MKSVNLQITREQSREIFQKSVTLLVALLAWSGIASAQKWTLPATPPNFNVGVALQLTDGTIMVQQANTSNWWKLTPNKFAVYHLGTWSKLASMPAGYAPLYFASAVLPDGKVIVEGGEFNNGGGGTNLGAIYNPKTNHWTAVPAPSGWTKIDDTQSVVLANGTFMMANIFNQQIATLNEATLTWIIYPGTGKFDANDEEGWTLLPNRQLLTVDTYLGVSCGPICLSTGRNSEIYNPATHTWSSAGDTQVQLWDSRAVCGGKGSHEVGPAVLRPNGTVFATGSDTCGNPGHTAIYNTITKIWSAGPNLPGLNDIADGPAAILPDGNVLVDTNPGYGNDPSTLYEFNGTGFVNIPQPTGLNPSNTEGGRMLVIPSGDVLLTHVGFPQMWFYTPAGTYKAAWQPHICASCYPAVAFVGHTYTVSGTQFNGLTQGAAFGDDAQSATNFPLVRIRNNATGHYFFARTHNFSTMAVATGTTMVSTQFDILPTTAGTEFGDSTMQVIANGIPSNTVGIIVSQ